MSKEGSTPTFVDSQRNNQELYELAELMPKTIFCDR